MCELELLRVLPVVVGARRDSAGCDDESTLCRVPTSYCKLNCDSLTELTKNEKIEKKSIELQMCVFFYSLSRLSN